MSTKTAVSEAVVNGNKKKCNTVKSVRKQPGRDFQTQKKEIMVIRKPSCFRGKVQQVTTVQDVTM